MKRSPELAPLSRDHHVALEVALRLRRSEPGTVAAAVERFGEFWHPRGARHFEVEEEVLLPALPADDPAWSEATARVRREHDDIRSRAEDLLKEGASGSADAARELGERLHDHVRYEERRLFVLLEERLRGEELAALGRAIDAAERG